MADFEACVHFAELSALTNIVAVPLGRYYETLYYVFSVNDLKKKKKNY